MLRLVSCAINFDGQCGTMTVEVRDEAADNLLAAKMKPAQFVRTKSLPEDSLRGGHASSHSASGLSFPFVNLLADDYVVRCWSLVHRSLVDPSPNPSPKRRGEQRIPPFPIREGGQGVRSKSESSILRYELLPAPSHPHSIAAISTGLPLRTDSSIA